MNAELWSWLSGETVVGLWYQTTEPVITSLCETGLVASLCETTLREAPGHVIFKVTGPLPQAQGRRSIQPERRACRAHIYRPAAHQWGSAAEHMNRGGTRLVRTILYLLGSWSCHLSVSSESLYINWKQKRRMCPNRQSWWVMLV